MKMTAFSKLITVLLSVSSVILHGENFFPNGTFEGEWVPVWNRMCSESYLPATSGWKLCKEGNNQVLQSDRSGKALELQFEGPARKLNVSLSMMSSREGAPVTVEFYSYKAFQPLLFNRKIFKTGTKWGDYSFVTGWNIQMRMRNMAPMKLKIIPPKGVVLRVDNVRCEKKFKPLLNKIVKRPFPLELPEKIVSLNEKIPFIVRQNRNAGKVPFTVVLPFGSGEFKCPGTWAGVQVRNSNGKVFPAQGRVIARWPADNSVRALAVDSSADLQKGINHMTAEAGVMPENGEWKPQMSLKISATDNTGNIYQGSCTPGDIEINGPLRKVFSGWCMLKSHGRPDIPVQCRTGFFRNIPDVEIEVSLHNPYSNIPFMLRDAEVIVESGTPGKAESRKITLEPKAKPLKPGALSVDAAGGVLIMPQAAERHPAALSVDSSGVFRAALWPKGLKTLSLSHNLVLTRRFIWSPDKACLDRFGGDAPIAMAEPARFGRTRFFLLPLGIIDRKNYPYAAARIDESFRYRDTKAGLMEANLNGLFNYGDQPGGVGWGNLESFVDYSEILRSIVYADPEKLAFAFDRAVHYRDIDTFRGVCLYHIGNHVAGGTSYSHSWPQGIICHYLLTGDSRSRAVLEELANAHLSVPVNDKDISQARSLSRYLLGLVDLYGVLGKKELKERFYVQFRHAEKINLTSKRNDDTIFPWWNRLDPYQVWYGACAFMEMYFLTGDKSLLVPFRREMKASLNREFFFLDLKECWPGVPPEKGWPIQLGFHSRHRGSLIYPLLVFQSRIDNNPELLKLAQRIAYADWCAGLTGGGDATDFFRLSGQEGQIPEEELLTEAKQLIFDAASPKLLNGDFSMSQKWFVHWHLPATRQMGFDSAVDEWPLEKNKDFQKIGRERKKFTAKVSPWRFYSRLFGFLDRDVFGSESPSLGLQISARRVQGRSVAVNGVHVRLEPGRWRWRASFMLDKGMGKSYARMYFFYPGEKIQFMTVGLTGKNKGNVMDDGPLKQQAVNYSAKIISGEKPGWKTLEMEFTVPKQGIAMPMFFFLIAPAHQDSFIHLDDVSLEKI